MKKSLLFILALVLLVFGYTQQTRAENSATGQANDYKAQQVFTSFYNNYSATINKDAPVILDVTNSTDGTNTGSQVTVSATTDSIFVMGVTDEAIGAGKLGRVCIRGPHKVALVNSGAGAGGIATGSILSTSTTIQKAGIYTTSDGTAGGQLGRVLSTTATSDTGDASNTFWAWIQPIEHK